MMIVSFALFVFRPFVIKRLVLRADGYLGFDMYQDAIRTYRKALVLDSQNTKAGNWLGYAYRSMGDIDKAIAAHQKAAEIDPQNLLASYSLGMIYAASKDFKIAREYFSRASLTPPEHNKKELGRYYDFYNKSSLEMLSICQEKLGQIEEALKTCEKILLNYPDDKFAKKRIEGLRLLRNKN